MMMNTKQLEADLLAVAPQSSTVETMRLVEQLEKALPSPPDLLRESPDLLDGRWALVATVAAKVGETIEDGGQTGVVNASGIVVEASREKLPVQEVRVGSGRIGNEVLISAPFGRQIYLRVAGSFRVAKPPAPGRRAEVKFDTLELFTSGGRRIFSAGWLFSLVRAIKPSLQNGDDDTAWLETTYISDRVRLGRGNKGSAFILERLDSRPGPLPDL